MFKDHQIAQVINHTLVFILKLQTTNVVAAARAHSQKVLHIIKTVQDSVMMLGSSNLSSM